MQNKFTLTQAQNRFLAKKNIVALIHSISRLENVNTTFPQTQTIVGGALNSFSFAETLLTSEAPFSDDLSVFSAQAL